MASKLKTDLTKAALNNDVTAVQRLLDRGDDVNAEDNGWTPLLVAVKNANVAVVRLLLQAGADVNWTNRKGQSALLFAVHNVDLEVVELLLQCQADVDQAHVGDGTTALYFAARSGSASLVRMLIRAGANVNLANSEGVTALMKASDRGYYDTVRLLLNEKADVKLVSRQGWDALMYASCEGHGKILELLLKNCDSINKEALFIASQNGRTECVKLLLKYGYGVNVANDEGNTALMYAAYAGHEAIAETLLKQRDINVNQQDGNGWTALHYASKQGKANVVQQLVKRNADVNLHSTKGVSVLMMASLSNAPGALQTLNLLLQSHADVNYVSPDGWSALGAASFSGRHQAVECLLQHSATDISRSLMLAVGQGHNTIADTLITSGANVNFTDESGTDPLMVAARANNVAAVQKLIQLGADVTKVNIEGRNAFMEAKHYGSSEVATYLDPNHTAPVVAGGNRYHNNQVIINPVYNLSVVIQAPHLKNLSVKGPAVSVEAETVENFALNGSIHVNGGDEDNDD
ncbi:ankyrin repeat domain-containing protein 50-like [Physella acuta]|uniref:ankyrin repeat domain-containing protein 50-like n=1 Tax=Physella acuta TaxID=109671 RepID=UPI0027DD0D27|nr:ankyrin repeat domain-containing protein 50-like [Physella acuta]XP_059167491.1 ankyrin repeat domain-containing protein 50-like [Physella acuta]